MRLIDADALELRYEFGYDHYGMLLVPYRDVNESIKKAKTVDAVPIVRCRDCKHYRTYIGHDMCAKNVKLLADALGISIDEYVGHKVMVKNHA